MPRADDTFCVECHLQCAKDVNSCHILFAILCGRTLGLLEQVCRRCKRGPNNIDIDKETDLSPYDDKDVKTQDKSDQQAIFVVGSTVSSLGPLPPPPD